MSFLGKMFAPKPVSTNQNFKMLNDIYEDPARQGTQGSNYLSALLTGQGDTAGAQAGWQNYQNMAGYQPAMDAMTRSVTGSAASQGLLRSGSTAKALQREGTNLNQQFYGNYLSGLSGLAEQGQGYGKLLSEAGGGNDKSMRAGTAGTLGSLIGKGMAIFSDRRMKDNIDLVGFYENGLPQYEFSYKGGRARWRGVMADDVEQMYPEALGETVDGFKTVNYAKLGISMERVDAAI
jgi:hypothetical protein